MLVAEVQLTQLPANQLKLVLLDEKRRHMTLQLTPQLVTGLQQLLAQALKQADWGFSQDEPAPAAEPGQVENPPAELTRRWRSAPDQAAQREAQRRAQARAPSTCASVWPKRQAPVAHAAPGPAIRPRRPRRW